MHIPKWNPHTVALGLGCLLVTACDPGDKNIDNVTSTTGAATGTDGDVSETDDTDDTDGTDGNSSSTGADSSDSGGEAVDEPCGDWGDSRACTDDRGQEGTQFCDGHTAGGRYWGPCVLNPMCTPGETQDCGLCDGGTGTDDGGCLDVQETCLLYDGIPNWDTFGDDFGGCNTPLVLSFDGQPARMNPARAATFDLDGIGGCITTDWPEAATPWLALDRDGNGSIESGRELFGSGTRLGSGERAPHGFAALAELDDNADGRIDARDAAFGTLVLWGDHDGDRRSTFAETERLSQRHVLSIELDYRVESQCDARGNCGVERARFHYVDEHGAVRQGEVVDLHLACQ